MAAITRCDLCKKLSDEAGEYIGRQFEATEVNTGRYAKVQLTITAHADYCITCIKQIVNTGRLRQETRD